MDSRIIEQKLASVARCVRRIQSRYEGGKGDNGDESGGSTWTENVDTQDIVALNLARAIGLCVDIALHMAASWVDAEPSSMAASFEPLVAKRVIDRKTADELRLAVGFRSVVVHNYEAIDWNRAAPGIDARLELFRMFAAQVIRFVDSQNESGSSAQ